MAAPRLIGAAGQTLPRQAWSKANRNWDSIQAEERLRRDRAEETFVRELAAESRGILLESKHAVSDLYAMVYARKRDELVRPQALAARDRYWHLCRRVVTEMFDALPKGAA